MEIEALRFLLAFFAGVFLTISGSLVQNTTQNSLASPSTLGFDGGAVLCVLIAQGLLQIFDWQIPLELLTFITFNLLFFLIIFISRKKNLSLQTLDMKIIILIGLAFNLLVGAIFSVIQFLFMTLNLGFPTGLWFGSFKFFYQYEIFIYLIIFVLLLIFLLKNTSALRLSSIGISFARGLGVDILKMQKMSLYFSLYLTGVVISFFGVFSFLSLIIPHILRLIPFIKNDMRVELSYGALLGGVMLALLDTLSFNFPFYGAELPVGMISSVLGSFVLIFLLSRNYFKSLQK